MEAQIRWLCRHELVDGLPAVEGMGRQDRPNRQTRSAGRGLRLLHQ